MFKKVLCIILASVLISSICGCGGTVISGGGEQTIDKNKEQIYVYVTNAGLGLDWVLDAAEEFNTLETSSKYQVIIVTDGDDGLTAIGQNLEVGSNVHDAFFCTAPNLQHMINKNLLEDLSDIYNAKIPGEDVTIKEKIKIPENAELAFSKKGEGLYGLPFSDGFVGFVFDHQLFLDKGWLFFNDGTEVLTNGPDGKSGTYDDGQPTSIEEWEYMLRQIATVESNSYPFVFTTQYPDYMTSIVDAIMAQYSGLDAYKAFTRFDGSFEDENGNLKTITKENGYEVYNMPGLKKGVEFVDKYLTNVQDYVAPISWNTTGTSHRDAQGAFVYGYAQSPKAPLTGMLFDGNWWENEARDNFNTLVERNMPERGYGKRDYRYMMFPKMAGQKGIDGKGHGSVLNCMECGSIFVPKQKKQDDEKLAKTKEFIAYTLKDEHLQNFTVSSGSVRPYKYELTKEQYDGLTPFQKNVWTIYNDTENVAIVRAPLDMNMSPINYASSRMLRYHSVVDKIPYPNVFKSLLRESTNDVVNGMSSFVESNWAKYLKDVEEFLKK